jgi:hypothetical protein
MMGNASNLAATLLLFGAVMGTSPALAETPEGAYEQLSPGNQKIARALYDAQVAKPSTAPAPPTKSPAVSGPRPLTLDQIAALKQPGQGWGQVFRTLKTQGLLGEKNLGQVISRASQSVAPSVVTTAGNRAYPVTRPAHVINSPRADPGTPAASVSSGNAAGNGHASLADTSGHGSGVGAGQGSGHE